MYFQQRAKCIILVSWSTNTAMAVIPSDSGKSVTTSIVIYCHFHSGKGIGCSKPAFFLSADKPNNIAHIFWRLPTSFSTRGSLDVVDSPMHSHVSNEGTAWSSFIISCLRDCETNTYSWPSSTWRTIPWGEQCKYYYLSSSWIVPTYSEFLGQLPRLWGTAELDPWIMQCLMLELNMTLFGLGLELVMNPPPLYWLDWSWIAWALGLIVEVFNSHLGNWRPHLLHLFDI